MKSIGTKLDPFKVTSVKPGFNQPEEDGGSAFEVLTERSFPGKWKVVYFTAKDFSAICGAEIAGFAALADAFAACGAVLLGGSVDNEYAKLAWRRESPVLSRLNHHQFADSAGVLVDQLGVRDRIEGVAVRATFIIDPDNTIQHVSANNLKAGRNPDETLRILQLLQSGDNAPAHRRAGMPGQP
ncbi:Alkyl hydroperoxide reductase subunit C [Pigmentiphaga humi]|uniref:Alkyl hydroperoxide reductase C n=1 Tax=Pigmentiphaga humi TaxID=2478468 RepID=A0A3P4B8K4_9BURK|nr:redoxin domain-containing protein [Pigmentiphaga humi]VCU72281.1 Alkyl hydroperoxide reductase subunit C [Pigmentiphaga humi]